MPRKTPPLTETHPDLVKEWNAERNGQRKPEELTKWSKVSVWWRCLTCANEWKNQVSNRTHSNNGCPCCNIGRLHSDGRNSLEKRNPELASQWHPTKNDLSPSQVTLNHNKKVWWLCNDSQCEHPHEWQTSPSARVSSNSNCPFCYGNHSFCPCDSIATTHPELASQLHTDEPIPATELTAWSEKKVLWFCDKSTCEHEHSWSSTVHNRSAGNGCPYCAGKKVCKCNSFAGLFPEKASQWSERNGELSPFDFTPHSSKKFWWKCANGSDHEWEAPISDRTRKDQHGGCPYCSNPPKLVSVTNSLATKYPEVATYWHPEKNGEITPSDVLPSAIKNVWWKCDKGPDHEWQAPPAYMVNSSNSKFAGQGCAFCSGQKTSITNRLDVLRPELVGEWHPSKNGDKVPSDFTFGSNRNVWWLCSGCGEEWRTNISNRSKGKGCAACASYGFDPSKPAYYYAMEIHGPTGIWWYKGGIAADPEMRRYLVERSLTRSDLPLEVRLQSMQHFDKGRDARKFERILLDIDEIRAVTEEKFDGCRELFEVNPLEYAIENDLLVKKSSQLSLNMF